MGIMRFTTQRRVAITCPHQPTKLSWEIIWPVKPPSPRRGGYGPLIGSMDATGVATLVILLSFKRKSVDVGLGINELWTASFVAFVASSLRLLLREP